MQAIQTPLALDLASEAKKAVTPDEFMNDTMKREKGLNEIQAYLEKQKQKAAKNAAKNVAEQMIITALQNSVPTPAIEAMRQSAGITEARLTELRAQAQIA